MKIIATDGECLDLKLDAVKVSEVVSALTTQAPDFTILEADGARHVINMRNVFRLEIEAPEPAPPAEHPQPDAEPEPEEAAPESSDSETPPAPTPEELAALTKAQLTAALTDAGVEHDAKATKAELVDAAVQAGVTPPTA